MKSIPFYENYDNNHCFQAVLRMILKYYRPDQNYTWAQLERITARKGDLWTWPTAGMLWLHQQGFEVHDVEAFDYAAFAAKGGDYLLELFGDEVGRAQIAHSDLPPEIDYAKQIVQAGLSRTHLPDIAELKDRLDQGYFVICNVNQRTLNHQPGYVGHFVLVTGHEGGNLIIHDPGLPPRPDWHIPSAFFEQAWAYPNADAKNYIAIKQPSGQPKT